MFYNPVKWKAQHNENVIPWRLGMTTIGWDPPSPSWGHGLIRFLKSPHTETLQLQITELTKSGLAKAVQIFFFKSDTKQCTLVHLECIAVCCGELAKGSCSGSLVNKSCSPQNDKKMAEQIRFCNSSPTKFFSSKVTQNRQHSCPGQTYLYGIHAKYALVFMSTLCLLYTTVNSNLVI